MIGLSDLAGLASGGVVGFVLGLVGGGGSILAVPLLVYGVGLSSVHLAIGTSAVAVAVSAAANLVGYARAGNVKWPCALVFAAAGVAGAALGSQLGKAVDGARLLLLFGLLMLAVAAAMLLRRGEGDDPAVRLTPDTAGRLLPRLVGFGGAVGMLAGFFGIGGGFLVVPGLLASTRMPMIVAIGSSLVAVTAFGATTAASYAVSGLVDWRLVAVFVAGGVAGGAAGTMAARRLATRKTLLSRLFAVVVAAAGLYVVMRSLGTP